MIDPTADDLGRAVIYTGNRYPGGQPENGVITGFNHWQVFVRYGADNHPKVTSREDLEWALTEADFKSWRFQMNVMHINGGRAFFGWGHRCVDQPRLLVIDKYFRKDRSTQRSYVVDDKTLCATLDEALAALSTPIVLSDEERDLLRSMPADRFYPDKRAPYVRLSAMGLVEWQPRDERGIACRITPAGLAALKTGAAP